MPNKNLKPLQDTLEALEKLDEEFADANFSSFIDTEELDSQVDVSVYPEKPVRLNYSFVLQLPDYMFYELSRLTTELGVPVQNYIASSIIEKMLRDGGDPSVALVHQKVRPYYFKEQCKLDVAKHSMEERLNLVAKNHGYNDAPAGWIPEGW
jgi:hypothetical protein